MYLFLSYRNQEIVMRFLRASQIFCSSVAHSMEQTSGKEHPYLFSQCQVKGLGMVYLFPTHATAELSGQ